MENQEKKLEELFRKLELEYLTKEARERLNRVKLAHPEVVEKFRMYFIQMLQYGKFVGRIDENRLKVILSNLSEKRERRIRFVRK